MVFGNPFYSPKQRDFSSWDKLLSCKPRPTYNCKLKSYPDGTMNFTFHHTDIFGREEVNRSFDNRFYENISPKPAERSVDLEYMQWQHYRIKQDIDVYFKSVDNYLALCSQSRSFDRQLSVDLAVISDCLPSDQERSFLSSLKSSFRKDNLKRARELIFDFALCNEWEYFFTGTFDQKKYNSKNAHEIKKPLRKWFNHMQERYGLSYLVIFEYHKKGAIHIHGLLKSSSELRLSDSGTKVYYGFKKPMRDSTAKKHGLDPALGKTVYNLATWKFGWSTAIKCYGSQGAISHYMTKYITKSNEKIMGRYFWHSRDLQRPTITYMNFDYDKLPFASYHGFKYFHHNGSNELYNEWTSISDYIDSQSEGFNESEWIDL